MRRNTQPYIKELRQRDGDLCGICGLLMLFRQPEFRRVPLSSGVRVSIDHITPRAMNGSSELSNLRLAHKLCNFKRAHYDVTDDLRRACKTAILKKYGFLIADIERELSKGK